MTVLAAVIDPDGRRVELTAERWVHIIEPTRHPELEGFQAEIVRAVEHPEGCVRGRAKNEVWFYVEDVGPSSWLRVVVAYEGDRGWIVTVLPRRTKP